LAAGAGTKPEVSLDADESWQRFSANYYIPPPFGGNSYWIGQAGVNLHWDLDFWGRQAALIEQARSQMAASELDAASARLALGGSIAQAYLDLDRSWEMIDIATRLQEQREQLLKLTQQRVSAGLDTQVELKIAEAALPQARAARLQAESARDLAVHRLAALAGYGADHYPQIQRPKLVLETALPLPDQLPVDLLAHRPGVLAARARVDAASAGRKAAHAAFYPDISLKAFAGTQAIGLDKLTDSGSLVYGVGPALHLPIFDAQRLRAGYKGATAELDASVANYNAVVLDAVRETADQISLGDSLTRQIGEVRQTLDAASAAYSLAQKRYAAGLTTQLIVLRAESQVLDARRELVTARTSLVTSRVTLLLMLGGSFDPATPAASSGSGAI
jgi:NodT family efflux transporter outer membrane factor (OMF) lipoprotein